MDTATYRDPRPPLEPPFLPSIPAMLHWLAAAYDGRDAQVRGADRITFNALEQQSAALARGLLAQGIGKGSRVGILMPNGPALTVAFMAAARIGALVAPLSTLYRAPELAKVLKQGDIELLLTSDRYLRNDYLSRLEEAFPSLAGQQAGALTLADAPYLRSILVWGECDRDWARPGPAVLAEAAASRPQIDAAFLAAVEAEVVPADLLCVIFTSGSTADPKAVVHSHGALLRVSWQKSQLYWALGEGDRIIGPRPHFWIAGFAPSLFNSLLAGCCLIHPEDLSPQGALTLIETEAATAACGDAHWLRSLCDDPTLESAGYKAIMMSNECAILGRRAEGGWSHLNSERARRDPLMFQPAPHQLTRFYGMTETMSSHTAVPDGEFLPLDKRGRSGRPMPGVILRIVDVETRRPLGPDQIGEVLVGGYCLMHGLYKRERSEVFTEDGLYPTGDLGSMDADGYFLFHSRRGDMLKVRGANVAPMEVEVCLNALPRVDRSAVIGLPGPDGEVMLLAAVQTREPASFDEQAARGELQRQLSPYKVPRRIFAYTAEDLPLTSTGKIQKAQLAEKLTAVLQAQNGEG